MQAMMRRKFGAANRIGPALCGGAVILIIGEGNELP